MRATLEEIDANYELIINPALEVVETVDNASITNLGGLCLLGEVSVDVTIDDTNHSQSLKQNYMELEHTREFSALERRWRLNSLDEGYVQSKHTMQSAEFSSDDRQLYYNQISNIPLLTAEGEKYLARMYHNARLTESKDDLMAAWSRRKLINSNLRLVFMAANKRRVTTTSSFMDHIQEGTLGLERAVDTFDPERGIKFSTYVFFWIKRDINNGHNKNFTTIKFASDYHYFNKKYSNLLELDGLRWSSPLEKIAESLSISKERATVFAASERLINLASLDKKIDSNNDETLNDFIPGKKSEEESFTLEYLVRSLPEKLSSMDYYILNRYFCDYDCPDIKKIAEELGLKIGKVSYHKNKALQIIKENAENIGMKRDGTFDF